MRKYTEYALILIMGLMIGFLGGRQSALPKAVNDDIKKADVAKSEKNDFKKYWVSNRYGYIRKAGAQDAEIILKANKGDTLEVVDDSLYWYKVRVDRDKYGWISNKAVSDKFVAPPPALEIVEIDSRVTETNNVWWRYAWKLRLRNNSDEYKSCNAKIKLMDSEKFIIDNDYEYSIYLGPGETETFTGCILASLPGAKRVAYTGVEIF